MLHPAGPDSSCREVARGLLQDEEYVSDSSARKSPLHPSKQIDSYYSSFLKSALCMSEDSWTGAIRIKH